MFVNQRDLVWSMPLTRMVGRVVREGASLSKAPQWTGCKRCAELDNCNWFNYEGTRCRLFQCRGNTWGRTTNSYAGPKWKFSPSAQNTYILRSCAWFQEGPDGKALLFGDGGQNPLFCNIQAAPSNMWHQSWQLSSLHYGSTCSHSPVFDQCFKYIIGFLI